MSVERLVTVRDPNGVPESGQVAREALGHVDGAVAPPRAADPDREVRAVLAPVIRETESQESVELTVEGLGLLAGFDESRHLRLPAREGPETRVEVRVREEADVEAQVERGRQAVLEPEGNERNRQDAGVSGLAEVLRDGGAKLVDGHDGRVDHEVRAGLDVGEEPPLVRDGFGHGAALAERM